MLLDRSDNKFIAAQYNIYISPHEILKPYISTYNILFPDKNMLSQKYTLIPDASGTLSFAYDGKRIKGELWGASTRINIIGSEANNYDFLLLVELKPCGLYQLTGVDQKEFTDIRIDLDTVDKSLNTSLCNIIEQAIEVRDLVNGLNAIFLSRMGDVYQTNTIIGLIRKIHNNNGFLHIKELSISEHYSERHLNRLFCRYIGMNVKLFSRIVRINSAIEQLQNSKSSFTFIAQQAGFYDQSHFINDFKALCGVSPIVYLQNMSDFSNETLKNNI
ncbi:helix-turn-helix transcriptional regulator [Ruminiclostridium cellulolyticum]|uniref:Transcriptional regulator, AraC family n=1 Tax=Ruminiclostridium cellulolyticum (strain ATCC 35319 / DSM 5812 / JCM 6584 / H10) TaxID=394503 RepID=B8I702_RUMCH|nr:helix-turn-helix transcriptional regulator [Ruminiclostridium cellulolyticum]ACL76994.1 transcriptional regulator, AraC family [Ruminiclostridium cellulolyticum H10]